MAGANSFILPDDSGLQEQMIRNRAGRLSNPAAIGGISLRNLVCIYGTVLRQRAKWFHRGVLAVFEISMRTHTMAQASVSRTDAPGSDDVMCVMSKQRSAQNHHCSSEVITSPVTSTSVATNGAELRWTVHADARAGSQLRSASLSDSFGMGPDHQVVGGRVASMGAAGLPAKDSRN